MFGRRQTVKTLEETSNLEPIENPTSLDDLVGAIREITVERLKSPHKPSIETMQRVHEGFDDETAKQEYITDETLLQRINAARRQFNEWKGRELRSRRIPSVVEAGPSNYDFDKTQKKARYARESKEELNEKLDRVRAAANGARGRALEAVGSSVAEVNAERAADTREAVREQLESGMIVEFRNPRLTIGRVVRVNKKTVTVEYDRGYTEDPLTGEELDPMAQTRVDLDSEWLTLLTDANTIEEAEQQQDENTDQ
ncbi:hypothetical protein [Halococcus thailandensis]|uniref:Uncharacterized protein n=1 Tax=Halococcus thailandensis JCM 13552 TaxID=1227457 RepID=M0NGQ7_9EURY|nr:hypothetical protein [Halococcus thailandensis]EMA56748.1 hypothetical protein C451_00675 [Halococcus thailandensis JCM 13552]